VSYLIDTNVISELRKGTRANAHLLHWYESVADSDLYLSVLVLGEIRQGLERVRGRDPAQARALERWLRDVRDAFGERVLPISEAVAEEWGRMNAERPLPVVDGLLAATANVHGLTLVTHNVADVADRGVECLDPFKE
jgi:predicted nucleic acid-binding protein